MNLGFQWGGSVLAFLALAMVPIPFILERLGVRLREKSPWAKGHVEVVEEEEEEGVEGEGA